VTLKTGLGVIISNSSNTTKHYSLYGLGVVPCHWNWRRSIDHIRISIGSPL